MPKPYWRPSTTLESRVQLTLHARFGKGPTEKVLATGTSPAPTSRARPVRRGAVGKGPAQAGTSSAAYPTSRSVPWEPGGAIPPGHPTMSACPAHRHRPAAWRPPPVQPGALELLEPAQCQLPIPGRGSHVDRRAGPAVLAALQHHHGLTPTVDPTRTPPLHRRRGHHRPPHGRRSAWRRSGPDGGGLSDGRATTCKRQR